MKRGAKGIAGWAKVCAGMCAAVVGVAFGQPSAAAAQAANATASIPVRATIIQSASVRGVKDLNFGEIVAPASTTTREIDKADPNAGLFEVTGGAGQGVQVTFAAPTALNRVDGPGSMPVQLSVYGAESQAGAAGAQQIFPRGTVRLSNGRHYFFVAGRLTVRDIASNPAGVYTGQFELSVSHTTI